MCKCLTTKLFKLLQVIITSHYNYLSCLVFHILFLGLLALDGSLRPCPLPPVTLMLLPKGSGCWMEIHPRTCWCWRTLPRSTLHLKGSATTLLSISCALVYIRKRWVCVCVCVCDLYMCVWSMEMCVWVCMGVCMCVGWCCPMGAQRPSCEGSHDSNVKSTVKGYHCWVRDCLDMLLLSLLVIRKCVIETVVVVGLLRLQSIR